MNASVAGLFVEIKLENGVFKISRRNFKGHNTNMVMQLNNVGKSIFMLEQNAYFSGNFLRAINATVPCKTFSNSVTVSLQFALFTL
jgi:hypothetical protein